MSSVVASSSGSDFRERGTLFEPKMFFVNLKKDHFDGINALTGCPKL